MSAGRLRPAAFLDRDGVLNEVLFRDGAPVSPLTADELRIVPGARAALDRLHAAALPVYVVTNQPDLARGKLPADEFARIQSRLTAALPIDDVAVCPHDDADDCACRKPRPGMLLDLAAKHGVDLSHATLVGDTWKDMVAGKRAGVRTVLLRRLYNTKTSGDIVVDTLAEAVDHILEHAYGEHVL